MMRLLAGLGLLATAFSPLTIVLALFASPFEGAWLTVAHVGAYALPLLLIPALFRSLRELEVKSLKTVKVKHRDIEVLAFMSSFMLPITVVIFAPVDARGVATAVLCLLLVIIYIRGGLHHLNPIFALLGYRLYLVERKSGAEVYVMSRRSFFPQGDVICARKFSDTLYIDLGEK